MRKDDKWCAENDGAYQAEQAAIHGDKAKEDAKFTLWQTIIYDLLGTCDSPASKGEEIEALFDDMQFCTFLDQQIFRCTSCEWWCEIGEEVSEFYGLEELTCRDCADDEDNEDR